MKRNGEQEGGAFVAHFSFGDNLKVEMRIWRCEGGAPCERL